MALLAAYRCSGYGIMFLWHWSRRTFASPLGEVEIILSDFG